ncbi:MAG: HlyD family secretion protein [Polyangiaceae bacterium]
MATATAGELQTAAKAEIEASGKIETKKPSRARTVFIALLGVVMLGIGTTYALTYGRESTDDAQVEGRVINVSPRVQGQVAKLLVTDNQIVEEGEPIVQLDPTDFQVRVDAAKADLAAAEAQLANAQAGLDLTEKTASANLRQAKGGLAQAASGVSTSAASVIQAQADVDAAMSRVKLAQTELDRVKNLSSTGSLSQAALDQAQANFDQANASLAEARARLVFSRANTQGSSGGVVLAQGRVAAADTLSQQVDVAHATVALMDARVKQSQAALQTAELNLSYTTIKAPKKGQIARRTVEMGQAVSPDRPLLAIIPIDDTWIVANYKEDQLADMHQGQPVDVKIDSFGRRHFHGHVDSIAGGTGARFSLLPPDNASGNFIKVVQRVPVLIRLDGDPGVVLRPGMSSYVTVDTRVGK